MTGLHEEGLAEETLDEVIQFVRDSNPFSQHTWGWDMGRFVDFRWASNAKHSNDPGWFGSACRIFRDGSRIRAVSVAEYGSEAECVLTPKEDPGVVAYVLGLLIERHRGRGIGIGLEFSSRAEWLREVCRESGLMEKTETGCEWEFDLATVETDSPVPAGFAIDSLRDSPDTPRPALAECIERAFNSFRDPEAVALLNLETNPEFRPELSVFARSREGIVAAYCRGTVDPVNGVCGIDPICTHPDYRKLGLGKAIVRTVFARQREAGGRFSYIGSAPPPAPGTFLYRSLGPSDVSVGCEWVG